MSKSHCAFSSFALGIPSPNHSPPKFSYPHCFHTLTEKEKLAMTSKHRATKRTKKDSKSSKRELKAIRETISWNLDRLRDATVGTEMVTEENLVALLRLRYVAPARVRGDHARLAAWLDTSCLTRLRSPQVNALPARVRFGGVVKYPVGKTIAMLEEFVGRA